MGCIFSQERNSSQKGLKLATWGVQRKMKSASLGLGQDRVCDGGLAWVLINTELKLDNKQHLWSANLSLSVDLGPDVVMGGLGARIKDKQQPDPEMSNHRTKLVKDGSMVRYGSGSMENLMTLDGSYSERGKTCSDALLKYLQINQECAAQRRSTRRLEKLRLVRKNRRNATAAACNRVNLRCEEADRVSELKTRMREKQKRAREFRQKQAENRRQKSEQRSKKIAAIQMLKSMLSNARELKLKKDLEEKQEKPDKAKAAILDEREAQEDSRIVHAKQVKRRRAEKNPVSPSSNSDDHHAHDVGEENMVSDVALIAAYKEDIGVSPSSSESEITLTEQWIAERVMLKRWEHRVKMKQRGDRLAQQKKLAVENGFSQEDYFFCPRSGLITDADLIAAYQQDISASSSETDCSQPDWGRIVQHPHSSERCDMSPSGSNSDTSKSSEYKTNFREGNSIHSPKASSILSPFLPAPCVERQCRTVSGPVSPRSSRPHLPGQCASDKLVAEPKVHSTALEDDSQNSENTGLVRSVPLRVHGNADRMPLLQRLKEWQHVPSKKRGKSSYFSSVTELKASKGPKWWQRKKRTSVKPF